MIQFEYKFDYTVYTISFPQVTSIILLINSVVVHSLQNISYSFSCFSSNQDKKIFLNDTFSFFLTHLFAYSTCCFVDLSSYSCKFTSCLLHYFFFCFCQIVVAYHPVQGNSLCSCSVRLEIATIFLKFTHT